MANFGKAVADFEELYRKASSDNQSADFDNVHLADEWLNRVQMEDKRAKNCLEGVHQKLQGDEAEKVAMQQEIATRQREIDAKKSEKVQKREYLELAKKCLENKKSQLDSAAACLQNIQENYDKTAAEFDNTENRMQFFAASYKEELNLEFSINGPDVTIAFTNISASNPESVHRIVLKKQRAAFKVSVCEPKINISKRQLDDLNQHDSWKQFLIQVRKSFLALYEK